jgi:ABC-type transport system involved in cytochrome c biogenesis ATPase subunit
MSAAGAERALPVVRFAFRDLRLDEAGTPRFDGEDVASHGQRLLVLGAPRVLFLAATGAALPARGSLWIDGRPAAQAVREGRVAAVRFDVPVPPAWTALAYATWRARLAGQDRRVAARSAADALERFALSPRARVAGLSEPARRGFHVAAAYATGAPCLVLDDVYAGLSDGDALALARVLALGLEPRGWIVFAARAPLASRLGLAADEALVFAGSALAAAGDPAEVAASERSFALRLEAPGRPTRPDGSAAADAFFTACLERGARIADSSSWESSLVHIELGGAMRPRDLFRCAEDAGCTIVELAAYSGALT